MNEWWYEAAVAVAERNENSIIPKKSRKKGKIVRQA